MAGAPGNGTGGPLRNLDPLFADAGLTRRGTDLRMAGVPLAAVAAKVGTPAYVYNAEVIRGSYQALDDAFAAIPHRICYAIKANSNLAVLRVLLPRVGRERYAVPLAHVAETVEFDAGRTTSMGGREAFVLRDRVIPTTRLRDLLQVRGDGAPLRPPAVILETGTRKSALVVDALLGQQEIVVEPFEAPSGMLPLFSGATILGDGEPALILDAAALV